MLIMRFRGGLGNQMFQYALYRSLITSGKTVKADISPFVYDKKREFVLDKFPNVKMDLLSKSEFDEVYKKYRKRSFVVKCLNKLLPPTDFYYIEKFEGMFHKSIFHKDNKIIDGYFQNEKYFIQNKAMIREELSFPKVSSKVLARISEDLEKENNSVSIHIRRGDYLELDDLYGGICTLDYYQKAIEYIEKKIETPKYYIVSDDIDWVKENLKIENATYINREIFDYYEDWYDMYIMRRCHHNIIANSSFSWWGAWLNEHEDKIVIRPEKWNRKSKMKGLSGESWIEI